MHLRVILKINKHKMIIKFFLSIILSYVFKLGNYLLKDEKVEPIGLLIKIQV